MSFMVFIEKKYICLKRKTDFRRKKGKLILEYTTTCHLQKKNWFFEATCAMERFYHGCLTGAQIRY